MIRGNLDRLHFGDLLHWLELGGHTGRLTLTDDTGERRLDLLHGRVVYISSTIPEERLATWLTRDGLLGAVFFLNATSTTSPTTQTFSQTDFGGGLGVRIKFNKNSRTNLALDRAWGAAGSKGWFMGMTEVF